MTVKTNRPANARLALSVLLILVLSGPVHTVALFAGANMPTGVHMPALAATADPLCNTPQNEVAKATTPAPDNKAEATGETKSDRSKSNGRDDCTSETAKRILIVGDSWAMSITAENRDGFPANDVFDAALAANGLGHNDTQGAFTAWGGRKASDWARPEHLATIVTELTTYPTIDVVHLIIGGNDFLNLVCTEPVANLRSRTAEQRLAQYWQPIVNAIETIITTCLALRPEIRVVLADYDYLDYSAASAFWGMDFQGASTLELNTWFTELGAAKLALTQSLSRQSAYLNRVGYVQNWGTLQYHFGNPPQSVPYPGFPPEYDPYPGGDLSAPMPPGISPDGIHPNDAAHTAMLQNAIDAYYKHWLPATCEDEGTGEEGEGENEGEDEGVVEGEEGGEGDGEGEREGEVERRSHSADQDEDNRINLSELMRVIQFFNASGYHCAQAPENTEDGYAPGPNPEQQHCAPHDSDYSPQNWVIGLSELLRLIQFYNAGGYHPCPDANPPTEDNFCVGPPLKKDRFSTTHSVLVTVHGAKTQENMGSLRDSK